MVTRWQFSREFKIEAVKPVTERGVAASQAPKDLDVSRERVVQVSARADFCKPETHGFSCFYCFLLSSSSSLLI